MTLFPIVERELRIASRRALTFWLRVIAACAAFVVAAGLLAILLNLPGGGGVQAGEPLFLVLTWMAFVASLAAGVFFTSDCLSEEKREGTLGFLFLTDLRGYDVVFGKLIGTLCRCVFALMAIFPVLACALLFGGVEGGQFWRTVLALLHTLFFSLAAGMFVSSLSHHPQKALAGTVALLAVLCGGGAAVDGFTAWVESRTFEPFLFLASPAMAFANADVGLKVFWRSMLVSEVVAWLMLFGACVFVPRMWQEKRKRTKNEISSFSRWLKFGSAKRRAKMRGALMDGNPTEWLARRDRSQVFLAWGVAVFVVFWFVLTNYMDSTSYLMNWFGWRIVNIISILVLYLWVASQACQFFADAKRGWLIELMLWTPLDFRKITPGAWRGFLRMYGAPVGIVLVVGFISQVAKLDGTGWMTANSQGRLISQWIVVVGTALCGLLSSVANLVALAWFGMWMGLTSRNGLLGTLKTIVIVQIGPWMAIWFAGMMVYPILMMIGSSGKYAWFTNSSYELMPVVSGLLMTGLTIGKDLVFYVLARQKMVDQFRVVALQAVAPVRRAEQRVQRPKAPSPAAPPPVIVPKP